MTGLDLRNHRKLLKLTQIQMAAAMGVAPRTYIRWEHGGQLALKVENLANAVLARQAAEQPRRDARFRPPPTGKRVVLIRGQDGMDITHRMYDDLTAAQRRRPGWDLWPSLERVKDHFQPWRCDFVELDDHYRVIIHTS